MTPQTVLDVGRDALWMCLLLAGGPLLAMLGNHRGELVWAAMRGNVHLKRGLLRAGFRGGWLG